MAFSFKNSKGVTYWLHKRVGRGGATLFFFSKDPTDAVDKPEGYDVFENARTGLPMLKKK